MASGSSSRSSSRTSKRPAPSPQKPPQGGFCLNGQHVMDYAIDTPGGPLRMHPVRSRLFGTQGAAMKIKAVMAAAILGLSAGLAAAQNANQGVSKNEIVLGSIQDLSGPIAGFGKQVRLGMMLRVDEINEQGGVNGRKIRLIVEDSAYDPKKAVLAAQKLVNQDKIFAMVGHIGTAQNLAAMPVQFEKNVINFFPVTAAREMYDPF